MHKYTDCFFFLLYVKCRNKFMLCLFLCIPKQILLKNVSIVKNAKMKRKEMFITKDLEEKKLKREIAYLWIFVKLRRKGTVHQPTSV